MPYIVTTKRPGKYGPQHYAHEADRRDLRAVATLEEARVAMWHAVPACDCKVACEYEAACAKAFRLPESGGTVGPLPDGTVIEVEPWSTERAVEWLRERDLLAEIDHRELSSQTLDLIAVDHFNAREAGQGQEKTR